MEYEPHRKVTPNMHPYLVGTEAAVLNGQAVARLSMSLKGKGFVPDVMIGNPGWGETLFLKDVWPDSPLIQLSEFYYNGRGADVGFDPEFHAGPDAVLRARIRSAQHLLAIEAADLSYAPTEWQKQQFPKPYHAKLRVIHDGIDVDAIKPDPAAVFALPNGANLTRQDEVLTYVSRNLEPYRGFHSFMRALPRILADRPNAQVVIVGGDDVSYGASGRPQPRLKRLFAMAKTAGLSISSTSMRWPRGCLMGWPKAMAWTLCATRRAQPWSIVSRCRPVWPRNAR